MLVVLVWILFDFYHFSLNLSIYPGYVCDIVMYITCLEDRYVGGSCVNIIWFLSHLSKPVDISWICSWHCYVYNEFRRQVCWWFFVWNCDQYCYVHNICFFHMLMVFPEIKLWSVVWYFVRVLKAILDMFMTLLCL